MITRSADFNNFKSKEFRGDALLKFVVSDIFIKKYPNFATHTHIPKIDLFLRNKVLMKVALKLSIEPLDEDLAECRSNEYSSKAMKPYANAVEAHIYDLFANHSLLAVYEFIEEHLFTKEATDLVEAYFKNEHNKERSSEAKIEEENSSAEH
jgi:dsRNA-specific ribonuclease